MFAFLFCASLLQNNDNTAFIQVLQEGYAALTKAVQAAVPEVTVVAIV